MTAAASYVFSRLGGHINTQGQGRKCAGLSITETNTVVANTLKTDGVVELDFIIVDGKKKKYSLCSCKHKRV